MKNTVKNNTRLKKSLVNASLLLTLTGSLFISPVSLAQSTGVLGLYQTSSQMSHSNINTLEKTAHQSGCAIRREGSVLGAQGNYDLDSINGFFLLECEKPVMDGSSKQDIFARLKKQLNQLKLMEGNINQFGQFGLAQAAGKRSYILKVSDYNNQTPIKRERDLALLGKQKQTLNNHYNVEAFLKVNDAAGMARPDEVVVIYYDSPQQAEQFRAGNPEFMEKIGQFNQDHISRFSYLQVLSHR